MEGMGLLLLIDDIGWMGLFFYVQRKMSGRIGGSERI